MEIEKNFQLDVAGNIEGNIITLSKIGDTVDYENLYLSMYLKGTNGFASNDVRVAGLKMFVYNNKNEQTLLTETNCIPSNNECTGEYASCFMNFNIFLILQMIYSIFSDEKCLREMFQSDSCRREVSENTTQKH